MTQSINHSSSHLTSMTSTASPDVVSSSDDYAHRFSGPIGEHLLDIQNRAVLRLLRPWPGANVLDVGGGHAQLAGPLLEAGHCVTVLGSDPGCLERPRRLIHHDRLTLLEGDLLNPPLTDKSVDIAVCFRIMAHVDDWRQLINGLCRVARLAVIVEFPIINSFNFMTPWLFEYKHRLEGDTRYYQLFRIPAVQNALAEQGFASVKTHHECFWPIVLHRKLKSPAVTRALEWTPRAIGLTRLFGSPVIMLATPNRSTESF